MIQAYAAFMSREDLSRNLDQFPNVQVEKCDMIAWLHRPSPTHEFLLNKLEQTRDGLSIPEEVIQE
jgi:hypothetical protein